MSAARTCARGTDNDLRFATPEEAADYQVQGNAPILPQEVAGTNITSIVGCGQQYGHVSVQYTSQQALYFAPALGFDHESPVTTAATASWGLGSNNPVPMVLSDLFKPGACSDASERQARRSGRSAPSGTTTTRSVAGTSRS